MSGFNRSLLVVLAALGAIAVGPSAGLAQTRPLVTSLGPDFPKTEIFIGNSFFYYNNGMPGHVTLLEKAADPGHKQEYRATMVTIGGSGLDWHDVESYFRPDAIGNYSFDEQNNVLFDRRTKLFDVAVMMDCSQCPIHPKLKSAFTEYVKKDSEIVRAHGARPVLFMSWAYADKPEMTGYIAGLRKSQKFVIENRAVFERAGQAVMAKIMENDKAAAALSLTGPGRIAIPTVNAPDLQKEAASRKR